MKRYKLLKDLPCAGAGEIFQQGYDNNDKDSICLFQEIIGIKPIKILLDYIDDFDEWFEEIEATPSEYYYITDDGNVDFVVEEEPNLSRRRKAIGNIFETKEEAEKYLAYLKAKTIIKKDTKGFKPDWSNGYSYVHFGCWNNRRNELYADSTTSNEKYTTIYFKTKKDLLDSFKKHPEEWKVYLTYEQ